MFYLRGVRYKNILQIDELEIEAGQITCILGESGSGKTTLLKLLNHLVSCDRGKVLYKGQDVKMLDAVALRREVVMLPQTPLLFPGTIKKNMLLGLLFSKKEIVADAVLLQLLEDVGLKKELDHDAGSLSGGEKQRLALSRIMLMDPEAILLDEPTSALDDDTGDKIMEFVSRYMKSKGKTLVMVTHNKAIARHLGEVVVTLSGGKVQQIQKAGGVI